jgi:hypothetical protein
MKKQAIALTLVSTCLSGWAQQADTDTPHDYYFGAALSGMPLRGLSSSLTQSLTQQVGGSASASSVHTVSAFQMYAGKRLNENVDIELGYSQTNAININFNGTSSSGVNYAGTLNMAVYAYEASVKLRPNEDSEFKGYYLKLGTHYSRLTNEAQVTTSSSQAINNATYTGWGPLWGLGYDFELAKDLMLRASFTVYKNVGGAQSGSSGVLDAIGLVKYF